ncbi:MAG TPA: flagellar biosynthetic protein FliQ [Polyangiaceae bacterium]|nr:flagellar biosynthetic protein FliQ [Polyangiaceae bacterium]
MSTDKAIDLFQALMIVAAKITGPIMLMAMLVGLIVGVLQAATQINENSIAFVAKLIAIAVTFVVMGPWMMQQLMDYTTRSIESITTVVR